MFLMRGKEVAAAAASNRRSARAAFRLTGTSTSPSPNANEAVKRAEGLGAKVLAPAFDVMDAGRMAVLQDPTGAVFSVWEPKRQIGVKILNEPGALCWSELTTRDPNAAEAFYTKLFGWTAKHSAPAAVDRLHRVQYSGTDWRRHDGDAPGHAGEHAVVLDAVLPGRRLRQRDHEGDRTRRARDGAANRYSEDRSIFHHQRSAGCDVGAIQVRSSVESRYARNSPFG